MIFLQLFTVGIDGMLFLFFIYDLSLYRLKHQNGVGFLKFGEKKTHLLWQKIRKTQNFSSI